MTLSSDLGPSDYYLIQPVTHVLSLQHFNNQKEEEASVRVLFALKDRKC